MPPYSHKKLEYGHSVQGPGMNPARSFGADSVRCCEVAALMNLAFEHGRRAAFDEARVGYEIEGKSLLPSEGVARIKETP